MAAMRQRHTNMIPLRAPGVYLEEVAPDIPPAFQTGVPVFVGFVDGTMPGNDQDAERATNIYQLTRWEQFAERVGRPVPGGFLGYAVHGFFENGGASCVVVPLREPQRRFTALMQLFSEGGLLESVEDIDLVCVPDLVMEEFRGSRELIFELQGEVLEHCQRMGDRLAILDTLPMLHGGPGMRVEDEVSDIGQAIAHWQALVAADGALYFPWLRVEPLPGADHLPQGRALHGVAPVVEPPRPSASERVTILVPPCGHIAGIYARSDAQIGVHKAPANEIVEGALDLEAHLTDGEQGVLNDVGVNCIRSFPRRGIRVWGARTLSGLPNWRYVHVRRLFLTLTRWVEHHMRDVVFEPNGPPLWSRVRNRLGAYCYELFQRGALKGRTPIEAFFVKCDAETNPLEVREAGQLICEVGLAPIMPAEFVVVRITQSAAGTTATIPT